MSYQAWDVTVDQDSYWTIGGQCVGKIAHTTETIHWQGESWLTQSAFRPGMQAVHRSAYDAVCWLRQQAELFEGRI